MKRTNKYIYSIIITSSLIFTACNKYLDVYPDMRTDINTVEKVAQLVGSAYPQADYIAMAETYSDNAIDKGPSVGHNDEPFVSLYYWKDISDDGTNTPSNYWQACYEAINHANQALKAIEDNKLGDEVLPYKGEALIARAYSHFMLVTFFAKAYEIGGVNDSPGIPYITEPENVVLAQYNRGTVASVYAAIEKDLVEGIALLPGGVWKVPKYHFTPAAAHLFASRFYLFKGDWNKVVEHANAAVPNGDYLSSLRPWNTTIRNYTVEEFRTELTKSDKNYNVLLSNTYSTYQRSTIGGTTRYGFGTNVFQNIYNGITATGARFYNMGLSWSDGNYTTYVFKEFWYATSTAGDIGQPYIMQPLFIADEGLMNRAEAYAQLGNTAAALKDLNQFASVRIVNYNATNHAVTVEKSKEFFEVDTDRDALVQTVLQFKQIGWMCEGLRWFDILRHRIPVVHKHIATDGSESFETLEPDDNRRMFQIPQDAVIAGVELNPR
ncbi:RagB/SusD family nutrient uptake outer membrane protein [Sphingobacterium composti Ten et al. 2007 non Yoo et al. 2007]|uniref:RagB/SusD family nutrient uptake outer membrane protein n=1 Tax=Sphingobacterium composti TaxID=363260 RepID=UPI0013588641|nr:RagB/SusD family nutrient uptake outer membrane protein [Sphingobacterium composti Ten et al. 2007 non Yoo et al. 2007]